VAGTALKLITAALYTNFTTAIVDDAGIEQEDAFLAGPVGEHLVLRLKRAPAAAVSSPALNEYVSYFFFTPSAFCRRLFLQSPLTCPFLS
jgi:hypothetical protein